MLYWALNGAEKEKDNGIMGNVYLETELKHRLDNAMAREKERLQQAKHRRNVAAMVDFTSNLLSLVGRRNGVRYMPVTDSLAQYGNDYSKAVQRYNCALNDYKGAIAGNYLRERLAAQAQAKQPVDGFSKNMPSALGKSRIDKVFKNSRTIKSNDYVFAKFR